MSVQDFILALGSVSMAGSLLPAIHARSKPPLLTSVPTAFWLLAFGAVYATLGLVFSACTTSVTGLLWAAIAIQTYIDRRRSDSPATRV